MGAGWDAELDGLPGAGSGHLLDLGEFGAGSGEADLEAFDFAEPSFVAGFFDPGSSRSGPGAVAWGSRSRSAHAVRLNPAGLADEQGHDSSVRIRSSRSPG